MDSAAFSAHVALARRPVPLYSGDCLGCGECCSRFLPLSRNDEERIARYVESNGVAKRPPRCELDLMCPYLAADRTCSVYEARPDVCRAYRCDRHAAGDYGGMAAVMIFGPYELRDMREVG